MKGMDTYSLLPENEYTEIEGRRYLSPTLDVAQTNDFINNLRANQQAQNAQITQQTQNLGTKIPSNLGGLTGGSGYWTSRYQTPQTNAAVANLKATAQAAALNQALKNEQEMWKKRYQDAYNAYQKRASSGQSSVASGELGIDTNETTNKGTEISQYMDGEYQKETLYPASDYVYDWQDASGQWWQVGAPTAQDITFGPNTMPLAQRVNGNIVTANGKEYIYLDSIPNQSPQWFPIVRSAGPGTYSPYVGS